MLPKEIVYNLIEQIYYITMTELLGKIIFSEKDLKKIILKPNILDKESLNILKTMIPFLK